MYKLDDRDWRECVECGFKDAIHIQPTPRELETRVNTDEEQKAEQTQAVKLLFGKD